jgi:RiboL-PSP-HEPN
MAGHSSAWTEFIERLREVVQLWRTDPDSPYYSGPGQASNLRLSAALGRSCVLLTSGHLQGFLEAVTQEFLEVIDASGIRAGIIPVVLRAELCLRYPYVHPAPSRAIKAETVHRAYLALWEDNTGIPSGTIKTDTLTDDVWNPWPRKVCDLLARADIDLRQMILSRHGQSYWDDLVTYVDDLVEKRNKIAHGDNSVQVAVSDVRRHTQWASRLARAADEAYGAQLVKLVGSPGWR